MSKGLMSDQEFKLADSGAISVVFSLMLIPVLCVVGLAVDYARASHAKTQMQSAADAAVLSAGTLGDVGSNAVKERILAVFRQNAPDLDHVKISDNDISYRTNESEIIVDVTGSMSTTFANIFGIDKLDVKVTSAAIAGSLDLELALVLDNTGSMDPFMADLLQSANDLVDTLYSRSAPDRLKIAVVPYVGAVNIGNGAEQRMWLDLNAEASWHAAGLEYKGVGYQLGCSMGPGGPPTDPGPGTQGSVWDLVPSFAWLGQSIFGAPAQAASPSDVPHPFGFIPPCQMNNPGFLNTFDFLDAMTNTEWKGCVEVRAEPHDVTDDAPSTADPDTLFVPWFWPDEADSVPMAAAIPGYVTRNDYIPDRLDLRNAIAPAFDDQFPTWGWANILKYPGATANIDEVAPDTLGPNKACPDPLLPLTSNRGEVTAKIDSLVHWNGSGTNIAEGLAWGWRVLSPTAPFTEGAAYGEVNKVIVLMTDGQNNIDAHPMAPVLSDYSAYGFLEQWGESRLTDKTYAGFKAHADARLVQVCQNAKAEGITIYTVAFGITDNETLDILRDCATAPPYAYTATTANDLVSVFQKVAARLTSLRLSR